MDTQTPEGALRQIEQPLRLTLLGLWAERLARAFWPLWSLVLAGLACLSFGLQDHLPLEAAWFGLVSLAIGAIWALIHGSRSFHRPTRTDALIRLDSNLQGHPISALLDTQAIGASDAASAQIWAAHRARMAARAAAAQPVAPNLRLASRDPYALRYLALTAMVMALMFGSIWRVASIADLTPGSPGLAASGPSWEGWAEPPAYTRKPALYLADQKDDAITLPMGSKIQIRLYGDPGALILSETVSGRTEVPPASDANQEFTVIQSGRVTIEGPGGRDWLISVLLDSPPGIAPKGEIDRQADGRFKQPFSATDDYGVTKGEVTIALDLTAVDRRFGLSVDPEPMAAVTLDLPLSMARDRTKVDQTLVDDLSQSLLSNQPVTMTFVATDAASQTGHSQPLHVILPGKRFFDPLAAALIEMRRDLMWSRSNAQRTTQILKAVTNKPDGFIRDPKATTRLRALIAVLDAQSATMTIPQRDTIAQELWQISLMVEEGDLADAMARLKRAQDRLDEAIRNGASPAEIDDLMQEMRDALNDYMKQQADKNGKGPDEPNGSKGPSMQLSQDQLQQMLDKLQQLMKEGRTAEAQELMNQLKDFMNNMQVQQGDGQGDGQGQGSPGQKAMKDLGQTLRDQQNLSDDAFKNLQQGQDGQPQDGQDGQDGGPSLADRQKSLRQQLDQMGKSGTLPGAGTDPGKEGRQKLDDAGRAMDQAEESLRQGDLPGALDNQADALQALRDGIRNFGDAMTQEQRDRATQGQTAQNQDPQGQRDPLGRESGENSAHIGSDKNLLQGDDVYRRAQDLLDEIRKRAGEQSRPENERSYLKRLLDLF